MIKFDKSVERFIRRDEKKRFFAHFKYAPGPCKDTFCSPLMKVELLPLGDPKEEYISVCKTPIEILVPKSKAKGIVRQRVDIVVRADLLKRSLLISGIEYISP